MDEFFLLGAELGVPLFKQLVVLVALFEFAFVVGVFRQDGYDFGIEVLLILLILFHDLPLVG